MMKLLTILNYKIVFCYGGVIVIYLKNFTLLNDIEEHGIVVGEERRKIFNNYYPLNIFPNKEFEDIEFNNITIFYGGNGSGKTTLLDIISEKLEAIRRSKY